MNYWINLYILIWWSLLPYYFCFINWNLQTTYITGRYWCVVFLTIEELDIPFITLIDGFKFRHYIWWAGFYHIILNGVLCFLILFCELCSTPELRVLIPSFSDLDSAVLQELMYVELYIKFIDGFWPLHVWCIFYRCEVWNARTVLLGALWWEQH